ncbi:MAG: thiolase family protein [Gammaproteobacteria bacterium]|nr:thiolase family protein [Gammaproteobacteria bacterium]
MSSNTYVPYGAYWSTPFSKWQGSLSHLHAMTLAAHVAKQELRKRVIEPSIFDHAIMGYSVPQHRAFYGLPWLTGMIGLEHVTGQTISQACATSARCVANASLEINAGYATASLLVALDRCSNGPHLYYPDPTGSGGTGAHEDWVMDNFSFDPHAKGAMLDTGENVAKKFGITTAEQHEVVLRRYEQYTDALANDKAFQKRYMTLPFDVPDARFKKTIKTIDGDEGIFASTAEGLAKLKPVKEGGTITFGGQTHPADGNAAMIVANKEKAREMSADPKVEIQVIGFGQARADKGMMPYAPVLATKQALQHTGLTMKDITAVKSHNPFAVNDIAFAREMGIDWKTMNNYGSSLIYGHPQGPTGMRTMIELIEELVIRGGGYGLFQGCAAGDGAMAVILKVNDSLQS